MEVVLEVSVEQVALKPAWLARLLVFLFFALYRTNQICLPSCTFHFMSMHLEVACSMALGGSTEVASLCALGFSNSFKYYLVVVESAF